MDISRGSRRLGTLCLVGFLVTLTTVSPRVGSPARLATEEAPTSNKGIQRGAVQNGIRDGQRDGKGATEGTIHLNFRNVDILQMITLMSELTGRNFLVDDKVRGRMTLIAPQPVTRAEAYQIFLAALAMQGFTAVSQGPISTIILLRDAKTSPLPTATDTARPHQ